MGGYEQEYVSEAFSTNWIAPLGPNVDAFECELAEFVGTKGAAAVSSGTAAIHLSLHLLGIGQGDVVICSSFTFVASCNPILYLGAQPILIDSEPESWNMSPAALERACSDLKRQGKQAKAAIIVNLYGQSADMKPLLDICEHYNIPVVEDAAESLGATYGEHASGTFGSFGIYSFNGNKIITTSGGGMVVSNDLEALQKIRFLSTQARDPARHYQHSEMGFNYRMSNVLAGIGRGQLRVLGDRVEARRKVFEKYKAQLAQYEGISFMPEASYGRSTRWLTALTVDPKVTGVSASQLISYLGELNIESRPVWKPLHMQPLFVGTSYYPHYETKSVSCHLFEQGICLPSGSNLTAEEQGRVISAITDRLNLR